MPPWCPRTTRPPAPGSDLTSDLPAPRASSGPLGAVLTVLAGVAGGLLDLGIAGRALADCDVGINLAANSFGLLLLLPFGIVANAVVFGVAFHFARRGAARVVRPVRRRGSLGVGALALLAGLLALALLVWVVMALAVPEDYPDPFCPDNVPPWWPSWLPV